MGLFDRSSSSTTNQQFEQQDIATNNLSQIGGPALVGSSNSTINIQEVDGGLVDASKAALESASSMASDANDLAAQALDANKGVITSGLDYGHDVLDEALNFSGEAIDNLLNRAASNEQNSFNFASDVLSGEQDLEKSSQATLANAITQAANATRSDAANTVDNIVKYGAIVIGIVALAYMLKRG